MKRKKTFIIVILVLIMLTIPVLAIYLPTDDILQRIPLIRDFYSNTSLIVTSVNSQSEIKINGKDYGKTNQTISNLPEGSYSVELERVAQEPNFYKAHTFNIDVTKNTESILSIEIGPNSIIGGYMLYYTENPSRNRSGTLSVSTDNVDADVYIDNEFQGKTPFSTRDISSTNHSLRVSATGYESQNIPIIVRDGYNLNVNIYLMPVPITFQTETNE